MDFSETNAVCDRKLVNADKKIEIMKVCEY